LSKIVSQLIHYASFERHQSQTLISGVEFFGYQLLEYLLAQVKEISQPKTSGMEGERILRSKKVQKLTGVSRTTLWRLERKGKFPARISLCPGSIGWRSSEVDEWICSR